jgi:hypothetical protein
MMGHGWGATAMILNNNISASAKVFGALKKSRKKDALIFVVYYSDYLSLVL